MRTQWSCTPRERSKLHPAGRPNTGCDPFKHTQPPDLQHETTFVTLSYTFVLQNRSKMKRPSVEKLVLARIEERGRGSVFTPKRLP
jgi:hypothetical protein